MSDGEIRSAVDNGELGISDFADHCLQPASYDLRIGSPSLRSGDTTEIDVERERSIVLNAGQFALMNTYESVKLPADIAGHIGVRSYYTREGMILLAGLQIDPGFEGHLVLGVYNASPR
jgi:dCTP deaminase